MVLQQLRSQNNVLAYKNKGFVVWAPFFLLGQLSDRRAGAGGLYILRAKVLVWP